MQKLVWSFVYAQEVKCVFSCILAKLNGERKIIFLSLLISGEKLEMIVLFTVIMQSSVRLKKCFINKG